MASSVGQLQVSPDDSLQHSRTTASPTAYSSGGRVAASEARPANPPRPMVSTAVDGTITKAPFSLRPS